MQILAGWVWRRHSCRRGGDKPRDEVECAGFGDLRSAGECLGVWDEFLERLLRPHMGLGVSGPLRMSVEHIDSQANASHEIVAPVVLRRRMSNVSRGNERDVGFPGEPLERTYPFPVARSEMGSRFDRKVIAENAVELLDPEKGRFASVRVDELPEPTSIRSGQAEETRRVIHQFDE